MNKLIVLGRRIFLSSSAFIVGIFLITASTLLVPGCNSVDSPPPGENGIPSLTSDDLESVNATSVLSKTGETEYQLQVKLKPSRKRSQIKALQMLAKSKGGKSIFLVDDGSGSDSRAGDSIYSARIPANCVPVNNVSSASTALGKELGLECKIHFVGPGEKCTQWSECPSRVERSILWGLIKYQTDIVVCFCLEECTISL